MASPRAGRRLDERAFRPTLNVIERLTNRPAPARRFARIASVLLAWCLLLVACSTEPPPRFAASGGLRTELRRAYEAGLDVYRWADAQIEGECRERGRVSRQAVRTGAVRIMESCPVVPESRCVFAVYSSLMSECAERREALVRAGAGLRRLRGALLEGERRDASVREVTGPLAEDLSLLVDDLAARGATVRPEIRQALAVLRGFRRGQSV